MLLPSYPASLLRVYSYFTSRSDPPCFLLAIVPQDDSGQRVMWAHRGILESTRAILRDLQQQGVLEAATATWTQDDEEAQQHLLQRLPSERARALAQRLRGAATGFRVVLTGEGLCRRLGGRCA